MSEHTKYFSKPFVFCIVISAVVIFVSLVFGTMYGNSLPADVANQTLTEIDYERVTTTWLDLFVNNYVITLISLVPAFGIAWMLYIQVNTGTIVGLLSTATNTSYPVYLVALLTHPVAILEFTAYILMLSENMIVIYSVAKGDITERLKKGTWITVILVTVLLLAAAVYEAYVLGRL